MTGDEWVGINQTCQVCINAPSLKTVATVLLGAMLGAGACFLFFVTWINKRFK